MHERSPDPGTRPVEPRADGLAGLYPNESRGDPSAMRSIKVRLPLDYHIRLHSLRLYRNASISATVTEALEDYFRRFAAERARDGEAPGRR